MTTAIATRATELLVEMFRIDPPHIVKEASLREDLDLDSIDTIDLLSKLNQEFSLELTPFDFLDCKSLGDFLNRLEEKQRGAPA